VDGFEAAGKPIDILVNNAGMQHRAPLEDFPADAFERLLQTNIASVFHVGQAVARHMIARGRARSSTSPACRPRSPGPPSRPTRRPRARSAT
jgi:NAD(P)-dependent dehydrogenase (short-subunit alcohol dehydrogenase family)